MRWSGGDLDGDTLEPLEPGSEETLPGYGPTVGPHRRSGAADRPSRLRAVRPRNPKVLRLWLIAGGLGVVSMMQFAGAAYVGDLHGDLRELDRVWRRVLQVDRDRARAHEALTEARREFGNSPGLEDQRDLLYDAARSRLDKLAAELAAVSTRSGAVTDVRADMLAALQQRQSDFRREAVPRSREDALEVLGHRLDRTLDHWMVSRGEGDETRLTTARELIERLSRMADEPTGLTIGAVSTDSLIVIDVDANDVARRPIDASPAARLHTVGAHLVVVDAGRARTFTAEPLATAPLWEVAAERAVPASDGESLWVQVGIQLRRIGADGRTAAEVSLPEGSRLVGAPTPTTALVVTPGDGLMVTAPGGGLEPGAQFRNVRRGIRAGTNGVYAAALDDRGRVLLARVDGARGRGFRFSALRADLPKLLDVAVLP